MKVNITSGIYADNEGDFRTSYPKNYIPVPKSTNINTGYLRPGYGIVEFGSGPGTDRGGINWNNVHYRVMGTKLIKIDSVGNNTEIADVLGSDNVRLQYSFDYLSYLSNGVLNVYDGSTVQTITNPTGITFIDQVWLDGYFVLTDSQNIWTTKINDPLTINPTRYGSSEIDPDPIVGLDELRNELVVFNRYTIEFFENVGGVGFPFQRIEGAQITRGAVGKDAFCIFDEKLAFVGSKLNEPNAVWIAYNGASQKISTREIDKLLKGYTETQLSKVIVEPRYDENNNQLWIKLPDQTIVYDLNASKVVGAPIWFHLHSSNDPDNLSEYRAQNLVWCYDKWIVGDPTTNKYGYLVSDISSHYGNAVSWEFATKVIYNESRGAIVHETELVCLTGNVALGVDPTISTEYSNDLVTWSQPRFIKSGKQGVRSKRLSWLMQGHMEDRRVQRFRGNSDSHLTVSRLEMRMEGLYN